MDWLVWRVVLSQIATLGEIERHYSLTDLMDAHDAIDVKMEQERQAMKGD